MMGEGKVICPVCGNRVLPTKEFDWCLGFLLSLFFLVGLGIYVLYFLVKRKDKCPICHSKIR